MRATLNPKLDHPAYHRAVKLPKYNGKVTVFHTHSSADGARVLRSVNPSWTKEDHRNLADLHAIAAAQHCMRHSVLLHEAAQETFGRSFQVTDYKISAIGSDRFSDEKKAELRKAARAHTYHELVARAHSRATRGL